MVKNTGCKGSQSILIENGTYHTDIVEMSGQGPRIVGYENIPGLVTVRRKLIDEILDA